MRPSSFGFAIHSGGFELVAARCDIAVDTSWNMSLRDAVPKLVAQHFFLHFLAMGKQAMLAKRQADKGQAVGKLLKMKHTWGKCNLTHMQVVAVMLGEWSSPGTSPGPVPGRRLEPVAGRKHCAQILGGWQVERSADYGTKIL